MANKHHKDVFAPLGQAASDRVAGELSKASAQRGSSCTEGRSGCMGPGVEWGVAEVPQQMLLPKKLGDPYQKRINRLIYIYAYIPYIVVLTRGLSYAYSSHPCAMYWICSRWGPIWAGFIVSGDGSNLVGGLSHPTKPGRGSSSTSMGWPTITNHNGSTIAWWFYDFPIIFPAFPSFSHPALWWWLKWWPRMPWPTDIGGETTCNILSNGNVAYTVPSGHQKWQWESHQSPI